MSFPAGKSQQTLPQLLNSSNTTASSFASTPSRTTTTSDFTNANVKGKCSDGGNITTKGGKIRIAMNASTTQGETADSSSSSGGSTTGGNGGAGSSTRRNTSPLQTRTTSGSDVSLPMQLSSVIGGRYGGTRQRTSYDNLPNVKVRSITAGKEPMKDCHIPSASHVLRAPGTRTNSNNSSTNRSTVTSSTSVVPAHGAPPGNRSVGRCAAVAAAAAQSNGRKQNTSALVEVLPTGKEISSAQPSTYSGSNVTAINTTLTEVPTFFHSSLSSASDMSRWSVAETAAPAPHDLASSNIGSEHSTLSPITGGHGFRSGGGLTAASITGAASTTTTIPHPPVILTARALSRASRASNTHAAQMRHLNADGAFATSELTMATTGGDDSSGAPPSRVGSPNHSQQLQFGSLDSTSPTSTTSTAAPAFTVKAKPGSPASSRTTSTAGKNNSNSIAAVASTLEGNASATRPPLPLPAAMAAVAATTPSSPSRLSGSLHSLTSATFTSTSGRGASSSRRQLRRGSICGVGAAVGLSFLSLSSPSIPSLVGSGLMSNSNTNIGRMTSVPRIVHGSQPRNNSNSSHEAKTDVDAALAATTARKKIKTAAADVAAFASTAVFRPMLPMALAVRRSSQESLSTVCSSSPNAGFPSPLAHDKATAPTPPLPRVLDASCNTADAPPSCSATAEGGYSSSSSSPLVAASAQKKRMTATSRANTNTACAPLMLPAHTCVPLPKVVVNVKDSDQARLNAEGAANGRKMLPPLNSGAFASSMLSSNPATVGPPPTSQHRPQCFRLLSRMLPNTVTTTPTAPLPPPTSATARAVGPADAAVLLKRLSNAGTAGLVFAPTKTNHLNRDVPALNAYDIVGVTEADDETSLAPPSHGGQPKDIVNTTEKNTGPAVTSAKAPGAAGGAPRPPFAAKLSNSPLLHIPMLLSVGTTGSSPTHVSVDAQPKLPPPCMKTPPRPATTCGADRRLSVQSGLASQALSPTHANLNESVNNNTSRKSSSDNFAATARRVSASLPTSPVPAPLAPHLLAPPQRLSPSTGLVRQTTELETSLVCLPPSKAAAVAAAAAVTASTTSTVSGAKEAHVTQSASLSLHRTVTTSTDSLNSRSGVTASKGCPTWSSTTQLIPSRSSTQPSPTPYDGMLSASNKTFELSSNLRAGLDGPGQLPVTEFTSMLQSSSNFTPVFAFPESLSTLEDPSVCFGTSMQTQRFVSNSRILASTRTPLNPSVQAGRGSSVDSVLSAPLRVVTAVPSNASRSSGVVAAGSRSGHSVGTSLKRSGPTEPDASPLFSSIHDVIEAALDDTSDEGLTAATAGAAATATMISPHPPLSSLRNPRPSGTLSKGSELLCAVPCQNSGESMGSSATVTGAGRRGSTVTSTAADNEKEKSMEGSQGLLPSPSVPHSTSSRSSSSNREDAEFKSSSNRNVLHAYPSIATFVSNEPPSFSSHENDSRKFHVSRSVENGSNSQRHHCHLQNTDMALTTTTGNSDCATMAGASEARVNRNSSQKQQQLEPQQMPTAAASTALEPNVISIIIEDLNANAHSGDKVASTADSSAKSPASPSTEDRVQRFEESQQSMQPTQRELKRRISSASKLLIQTTSHLADQDLNLRRLSNECCGSESSQSESSTTMQQTMHQISAEMSSLYGANVSNVTSGGASMTLFGMSNNTVSTTQAFTDFPPQVLLSGTVRRDRLSGSRRQSQSVSEVTGNGGSSVNSLTHTALIESSSVVEDATRRTSVSPLSASTKKRKRSMTKTVSKLWSKASVYGSHNFIVAAVATSTSKLIGAPTKVVVPAASAEPNEALPSSNDSAGEKNTPLLQFLPAPTAASTQSGKEGNGPLHKRGRHSTSSNEGSKSFDDPVVADTIAMPRLSNPPTRSGADATDGNATDNGEVRGDNSNKQQSKSEGYKNSDSSINKSDTDTLRPESVMSSCEEVFSSCSSLAKTKSMNSCYPLPLRLHGTSILSSRRCSSSRERSTRSSVGTAVPEGVDGQPRTRQRSFNTTSGSSTDAMELRDSMRLPVLWHSVVQLASNNEMQAQRIEHSSPLAPSTSQSRTTSTSSSATSSLSSESSCSPVSAVVRTTGSGQSSLSVTTITKPVPSNVDGGRISLNAHEVFRRALGALHVQNMFDKVPPSQGKKTSRHSSGRQSLVAPVPHAPSNQQHCNSLSPASRFPPGGHGLYAAFQVHHQSNTASLTELYAGQGQAAYEQLNGASAANHGGSDVKPLPLLASQPAAACQQMPNMSNPFVAAAVVRSRPGSSRSGSSRSSSLRPGSSRSDSVRVGSAGFRRPRLGDTQIPPTTTASLFHSVFHATTTESGNFRNGDVDDVNGSTTPLPAPAVPPNTVALPKAGAALKTTFGSARARAFDPSIVSAWVKAAQTLFPSSWSSSSYQLTSLRVPLSTNGPAETGPQESVDSNNDQVSTVAQGMMQTTTDPPRKRVFKSALRFSSPMDPMLLNAKGDAAHVTHPSSATNNANTVTAAAQSDPSPDSTTSGSSWRWFATQTVSGFGFAPINASNSQAPAHSRSRWSLSSTSKRKWASSMTSSHGSAYGGSHMYHGNNNNNSNTNSNNANGLLRAPSGSASLVPQLTGSTPTSPHVGRRGFSGRKVAIGNNCSVSSSINSGSVMGGGGNHRNTMSNGEGNTVNNNNTSSKTGGRPSPRNHQQGPQRQQSSSTHRLNVPARVTSAECRRNGQVVLMDAKPLSSIEQQHQQQGALAFQLAMVVTPVRNQPVSSVSACGGVDGSPRHFVSPWNGQEGQPPHSQQQQQLYQQAPCKFSEVSTQDVLLHRIAKGDRSRAQSITGSRGSIGSGENWHAAVSLATGEDNDSGHGELLANWTSSGVSLGFTPSTMSLVDLSVLLNGEAGQSRGGHNSCEDSNHSDNDKGSGEESASAAETAAAAAVAPVLAVASGTRAFQHAPHSSQQVEPSAKSLLSNNNAHYTRNMPRRSSVPTGALVSPVSLSILMNSISFDSNNGGTTTVTSNRGGGGNNRSFGTPSPRPASSSGGLVMRGSADMPLGTTNTSLSATLGSGPTRSRSNRSYSPPLGMLSCEAAPALFTVASEFAALQPQDNATHTADRNSSGGSGNGDDDSGNSGAAAVAAPFSYECSRAHSLVPSPSRRNDTSGLNIEEENGASGDRKNDNTISNTAEWLLGTSATSSPPPSLVKRSLDTSAPSPTTNSGERRGLIRAISPTTMSPFAASALPASTAQPAPSSRRASRQNRTLSNMSNGSAGIPAPPTTTSLASGGSGLRSRRVGSMLTAHNCSAGGVLNLGDSGNPPLRSTCFSGYSRHGSTISDAMSDHAGSSNNNNSSSYYSGSNGGGGSGNSPLASSLLYVPPELRRGPEWRHLQQYIACNMAQMRQHEVLHMAGSPLPQSVTESLADHGRGQAARFTECGAFANEEKKNSHRHLTTNRKASFTPAQHEQQQHPPPSPPATEALEKKIRSRDDAAPDCKHQHVMCGCNVELRNLPENERALVSLDLDEPFSAGTQQMRRPRLQRIQSEGLPSGEAGNGSYLTMPASASAPGPPQLTSLPPILTNPDAYSNDREDVAKRGAVEPVNTRSPRCSKTGYGCSADYDGNSDSEDYCELNSLRKSVLFTAGAAGVNDAKVVLSSSQHRLSEDRRLSREVVEPNEHAHSSHRSDAAAAASAFANGTRQSLLIHASQRPPQQRERMLSGVPFLISESDDDDTSRDGGCSDANERTVLTATAIGNLAHANGLVKKKDATPVAPAARKKPDEVYPATFDFSLSLSLPSAKFASTAPGALDRQVAALAEPTNLTVSPQPFTLDATVQLESVSGAETVAGVRRKSLHGATNTNATAPTTGVVGFIGKSTPINGQKSLSGSTPKETSFRSVPPYRYDGETTFQKLTRIRYSFTSSSDKTNSRSGSGRNDRRRSFQSPMDEKMDVKEGREQQQQKKRRTPEANYPASTGYASADVGSCDSHSNACNALSNESRDKKLVYQHEAPSTVRSPLECAATAAQQEHSQKAQLAPAEAAAAASDKESAVASNVAAGGGIAESFFAHATPATASTVGGVNGTKQRLSTRRNSVSEAFVSPPNFPQPQSQLQKASAHHAPVMTSNSPVFSLHDSQSNTTATSNAASSPQLPKSVPPNKKEGSLQLLSFSPLVQGLTLMADGLYVSNIPTSRMESGIESAATTTSALCTPITAVARKGLAPAEESSGAGSLSYTGGQQQRRSSVVSFEEPLDPDSDPFSREVTQIHLERHHIAERKGTVEISPTPGAARQHTTTSPSYWGTVHSPQSLSQQSDCCGDGRTDAPSSLIRITPATSPRTTGKGRSSLIHLCSTGVTSPALSHSTRETTNSNKNPHKPHNSSLACAAAANTPFLLPNCVMMSSFDLGSPSLSTLTGSAASPNMNLNPTSVLNAVSASGPLAMSGGVTSAETGDSFVMSTTEEHRTLMVLSAFPARQTPVATPSLLTLGEGGGGDHYYHTNNNNSGPGGNTVLCAAVADNINKDAGHSSTTAPQIISPSARRGGSRGRAVNDAIRTSLLPRPPSGGRVPSASSTATASSSSNNTASPSSHSGPVSERLLSHTGTSTTTITTGTTSPTAASMSSSLGAASRWHAFTNLSSPPRSSALMMRVSNGGASSEMPSSSARASPSMLPRPPSKTRLTVLPTPKPSTAAQHTTAGS